MIPRRFIWVVDTIALWFAFTSAYVITPTIRKWIEPGEVLHFPRILEFFSPVPGVSELQSIIDLTWIFLIVALVTLLIFLSYNDYGRLVYQSRTRVIIMSIFAPLAGISLIALISFALKSYEWSRLFLGLFFLSSAFVLTSYKLLLRSYFLMRKRAGYYANNVIVVGQKKGLEWMINYFERHISPEDSRLIGQLSTVRNEEVNKKIPYLGDVSDLRNILINLPIHEVIVVQPSNNSVWIEEVVKTCDYLGVLLQIVPEVLLNQPSRNKDNSSYVTRNFPAVIIKPPNWDSDALFIKRIFDLVVSGVLLIILSPVFLITAIAIKITTPDLPIFYPWKVVGQKGVEFIGYKFTTMYADADERKEDLQEYNEMKGPVFKIKNDPRVTPLGKLLRKFSINELPQLWSVFKGDMSLVGPRPAFRYELERYDFWHKRKLSIRPGITCLWQISGRNDINDFDEWVKMDLEYIDNWSLWLDFRILVRTVFVVIAGTGS